MLSPLPLSSLALAGLALVVPFLRPVYFPLALATAIPARWFSRIVSSPISARVNSTPAINRPKVPDRSSCCVTETTLTPLSHQLQSVFIPSCKLREILSIRQTTTVFTSPAKIALLSPSKPFLAVFLPVAISSNHFTSSGL